MKKLAKISAVLVLILVAGASLAPTALGQFNPDTPPPVEDLSVDRVIQTLVNILNWMYTIFFIAAAGFILYAAFLYLTAAGSDDRLKKAKNAFVYAIIAIGIALIAFGLDNVVHSLLT